MGLGRKFKGGRKKAKVSGPTTAAPVAPPSPPPTSPPPDPTPPPIPLSTTRSVAATTALDQLQDNFVVDDLHAANDDPDDLFIDDDVCVVDIDFAKRMTIAYIYVDILESPPQFVINGDCIRKDAWKGHGGVYSKILKCFLRMFPESNVDVPMARTLTQTIERVLANLSLSRKSGIQYEGNVSWEGGAKSLIELDQPEAQIICDSIEQGNSIKMTKLIVNKYRKERNLPLFGYNPIFGCYQRMKPKVIPYRKKRQGSTDPEAAWSKACYRQFAQLLVRFNIIQFDDPLLEPFRLNDGTLPEWLQKDHLTIINPHRVSYWDEMHRKCTIGARGSREGKNVYVCFPKDKNGKLDLLKGEHDCDNEHTVKNIVNVKYEKEVRLCLGVIKLKHESTEESVGTRLPAYSYTSKTIISFDDRDKYRKIQINFVRATGGTNKWVDDQREAGAIYQNDPILKVKGIGGSYNSRLTALGITEVKHLKEFGEFEINSLIERDLTLKKTRLQQFCHSAQTCEMEDAPESKDHRKEVNPYLSKYGLDNWETQCDKDALVGKVCIGEMVDHIFGETKKCFPDSEDWWVYHDALSLMTATRTVAYMEKMDYYRHWILPEHNIFSDLPECRKWKKKPVGNRPEVMPLDQSLNKDVHDGVDQQVVLSQKLTDDDDKKFSTRTPKHGLLAYLRVWDHHPPSERIIHDIDQTLHAMKIIVAAKGILVEGLATRTGDRYHSGGGHGGKRVRKNQVEIQAEEAKKFVHPELKNCIKLAYEESIAKVEPVESRN
jgi:hypothetical protein